jgi:VWFA-related protein
VPRRSSSLRKVLLAGLLAQLACGVSGQAKSPEDTTVAREPVAPLASTKSAAPDGFFRIDVEVRDEAGNPATDLAPGEFTLLDNGQPSRIFTVSNSAVTASDPPPELIFVLDTLSLTPPQLTRTTSAVGHFLRQNGGLLDLPCFLYRLTRDGLYSSVKATRDGNLLAQEVEQNKFPRIVWRAEWRTDPDSLGSWEARLPRNQRSLHALGSIAIDQREIAGRKVLVWIGPGWPMNGGDNGFDNATELSTRLREARITLDTVTVWPNSDSAFDYRDYLEAPQSQKTMRPESMALPVLATRTGGLVLDSLDDLDRDIERCAADAHSYYSLTFSPPRTDRLDDYHDVRVVLARPGMTARAPTGYYNEPVYFDAPRPGIEKLTVSRIEGIVHSNADLGRRLPNLELTERLSTPRLESLLAVVYGERERQALIALADLSFALPPPADEIVNQPAPPIVEQRAILERTVDYLVYSIPKLPDFFALRNTVRFDEPRSAMRSPGSSLARTGPFALRLQSMPRFCIETETRSLRKKQNWPKIKLPVRTHAVLRPGARSGLF